MNQMITETARKIYDFNEEELIKFLDECFFIINKKITDLEGWQVKAMLNGMYKYQGGMNIDDVREAFELFASGQLEAKIYGGATPIMIGVLLKAYKEKKYGKQLPKSEQPIANSLTDEEYWNLLLKHVFAYGSIPANTNWIAVYNHLVFKKWITNDDGSTAPICRKFTAKLNREAEELVREFIHANYAHKLHDYLQFKGTPTGKTGLGAMLKRAFNQPEL